MLLIDLKPEWLNDGHTLIFLCPHCKNIWLTCKNIPMAIHGQMELLQGFFEKEGLSVVPCKESTSWTFNNKNFESLTVTPSIDASASGHWHGNISNGEILT